MGENLLKSTHMSRFIIFILSLMPFLAIGQYTEKDIKTDSTYFFVQKNACDSLVWWEGHKITLKDGRKFEPLPAPIGWNEKVDCATMPTAFIMGRDTATLYGYFANTQVIDPGRQQARAVALIIYDTQFKRQLKKLDQTFVNSGLGSIFKFIEKTYGDEILGKYKYISLGADGKQIKSEAEIIKRPNGNYVLKVGENTFGVNIYGDEWIELVGLPGSKNVSLYRIGTKERWANANAEIQLVSKESLIIESKTIK